jgi:AcrR family transcriptional regulator
VAAREGTARARTRLDPSVRRTSILDAAERVFAGRNPSEVTFEEIAEAAGVSRGLVYNYFGDKSGLIAALYLRTFERLDDAMVASLEGHEHDGEASLRAVVGAYLGFARENQAAWRLIAAAEATAHPAVRAARAERFRRMAAAWGGSARAVVLAGGVVGLLEGATLSWLDSSEVPLDAAAEVLTRMLWGGVSDLSACRDLRLPPHSPFDTATFVPRHRLVDARAR